MLFDRRSDTSDALWNTGLAVAVWVSAGISGGHVNPAVRHTTAPVQSIPDLDSRDARLVT